MVAGVGICRLLYFSWESEETATADGTKGVAKSVWADLFQGAYLTLEAMANNNDPQRSNEILRNCRPCPCRQMA